MLGDDCANFISSCTGDECKSSDNRVKSVFTKYDHDKDGVLTEEDFLEFYSSACRERKSVVLSNLTSHHYRKDLKRFDEIEIEVVETKNLPRYVLSRDEKFFKMMFGLLDK